MGEIHEDGEWVFSSEEIARLRVNSLDSRARLILVSYLLGKKMFPILSKSTEIPMENWRSWWKRGVVPNGLIVEAIGKIWPQHAYWLTTGMTDLRCGHIMPPLIDDVAAYISSYPEQGVEKQENLKTKYSIEYLKHCEKMRVDGENSALVEIQKEMLEILTLKRKQEIESNFRIGNCK
jgi:hypothetical protein